MTKKPLDRRANTQSATTRVSVDIPELQQARALWARQQLPAALWLFERAVRRHPHNVLALVDASRAFGSVYQYRRAEALLGRLIELARGRGEILQLAAQSYRLIRRPEKAIECFQLALSAGCTNADLHLELALLWERCNGLDQAMEHAQARLAQLPSDPEGRLVKARLLGSMGEPTAAESMLREVARQRTAHWMTRMRAYSELARLLDSQAAYDDAWRAMLDAKSIGRPHAQPARQHRDRLVPPLLTLAKDVRAADVARWRAAVSEMEQPSVALLTGLPRSGTTLIERVLAAHSQIVTGDEWDAFPRLIFPTLLGPVPPERATLAWLNGLNELHLARKRHIYGRYLTAALGTNLAGRSLVDKNPSLLPLLPIYKRLLPASKLIIALRDPRDVLVSCLMTFFPLNDFSVDFLSLESAAARLVADLDTWRTLREPLASDWIEVSYERLVNDLTGTMASVLDHLGLAWETGLNEYRTRGSLRPVNSPSYDSVYQPLYTRAVGRWRNYERYLDSVLSQFD